MSQYIHIHVRIKRDDSFLKWRIPINRTQYCIINEPKGNETTRQLFSERQIHFLCDFEWVRSCSLSEQKLKSGSKSKIHALYFRVCHKTIVIIVNINDNCLLRHEILDENALHTAIWLLKDKSVARILCARPWPCNRVEPNEL